MAMKYFRLGCVCAVATLLLGGCGLKGDPKLPPDHADSFPRTYPQGAVPSDVKPENIFVERRR
jgi:predicted small lipoprotein YifL